MTRREESEGKDDETHSEECVPINDSRRRNDSSSESCDYSEPTIPTNEDIVTRAQVGIATTFPTTHESLRMCLAQNTSRSPLQRRYISPDAAYVYKKQRQILLAITERLGLPKGDREAFAFMERYERADYRQRRSVKTILEVRQEKWELHEQWMKVVRNMPDEKSSDANSMEQLHRLQTLEFISTVELPSKFNKMLRGTRT